MKLAHIKLKTLQSVFKFSLLLSFFDASHFSLQMIINEKFFNLSGSIFSYTNASCFARGVELSIKTVEGVSIRKYSDT